MDIACMGPVSWCSCPLQWQMICLRSISSAQSFWIDQKILLSVWTQPARGPVSWHASLSRWPAICFSLRSSTYWVVRMLVSHWRSCQLLVFPKLTERGSWHMTSSRTSSSPVSLYALKGWLPWCVESPKKVTRWDETFDAIRSEDCES